jgi:hypothetical protein
MMISFQGSHYREAGELKKHFNKANWPQAWSAPAVFCVLQAMLGLYPYAPLNLLLLDPYLPEWLPKTRCITSASAALSLPFVFIGRRAGQRLRGPRETQAAALHPAAQPLVADGELRGATHGGALMSPRANTH